MKESQSSELPFRSSDVFRPTLLRTKGALDQAAKYWVSEYGGEGNRFTSEQEYQLSLDIQHGLAVERILERDKDPELALLMAVESGYDASQALTLESAEALNQKQIQALQQEIDEAAVARTLITSGLPVQTVVSSALEAGKKAQTALVETNLRFAYYIARESVGIEHPGSTERFRENGEAYRRAHPDVPGLKSGRGYSDGRRGVAGSYRPYRSNKSIYASLEDRESSVVFGLMHATRTFKPTDPAQKNYQPKFISYAAWMIQSHLERSIEEQEHNGIRLPTGRHTEIKTYFGNHPALLQHDVVPENVEALVKVNEYEEFPSTLYMGYEGSIEELNDPYYEDDRAIAFEEIYADHRMDVIEEAEHQRAREAILEIMDTLSEREAGVIARRFGLSYGDYTFDGEGMTLDEIGDWYGVTRERIRQIENKTMAKLRHSSRSKRLEDYRDLEYRGSLPTDHVLHGDDVVLPLGAATYHGPQTHEAPISEVRAPFTSDEQRQREEKQSWQLYLQEPWDIPLRKHETVQRLEPVDPQLFAFIYSVIDAADSYHFQTTFAESVKTPYPAGLSRRIDAYCEGKKLTAGQISSIWERFMRHGYLRIQEEVGEDFSPDRVGQFFSKLIASHLNDIERAGEQLILRIPEHADGKIGYLANGLRNGRVKIIGNTGDYTGALSSGFAEIEIQGNVGNHAGVRMRDDAHLKIHGHAGYNIGEGSIDRVHIEALSARSIGETPSGAEVVIEAPIRD